MMIQSQSTIQTQNLKPLVALPPAPKLHVSSTKFSSTSGAYGHQVNLFISRVHHWASSQVSAAPQLTGGYQRHVARRQASGRPPVSFANYQSRVTKVVRRVLSAPGHPRQKLAKLFKMGKAMGIHPFKMMSLIRHAKRVNAQASASLSQYQHQQLNQLSGQLTQAQRAYGNHSPQAFAVQQKIDLLTSHVGRARQSYEAQNNSQPQYKAAKPKKKKKGFFGKIKGAFKKAFKGLTKLVRLARPFLPMIPGVGPLAAMAADGYLAVADAVKTKGKSLANAGMTYLQNKFPAAAKWMPGAKIAA